MPDCNIVPLRMQTEKSKKTCRCMLHKCRTNLKIEIGDDGSEERDRFFIFALKILVLNAFRIQCAKY